MLQFTVALRLVRTPSVQKIKEYIAKLRAIESLLEICSCLFVFAQNFNFRTKYENIGPNFPSYFSKSFQNPSFQAEIASLTCKFEQTAVQEAVNSNTGVYLEKDLYSKQLKYHYNSVMITL